MLPRAVVFVLLAAGLAGPGAPAATTATLGITRGPFVQNASSNRIQVIWRTASPGSTFVDYGPTPALEYRFTNGTTVSQHVVTLTDLEPGTVYFYRVGSDTSGGTVIGPVERFRTLTSEGPVSFVVIGDTAVPGSTTNVQCALAQVICDAEPDLVLHLGDSVFGGFTDTEAGRQFFDLLQPALRSVPFFLVPGNHDLDDDARARGFQTAFHLPTNSATGTELFYSFDHGDVHFTGLYNPWFRSYVFTNGSLQFDWLTNDLAQTTQPWKVLFLHMPVADSGGHAWRDHNSNNIADSTELMEALLPVAERYGVQMLFSGHDHNHERFVPTNGVHHVVSGGGGQGLYCIVTQHVASAQFWPVYHCLRVGVTNDTLTLLALGTNGTVFDSMTVQKDLPSRRLYHSSWHTPTVETDAPTDLDGNVVGQRFDFAGEALCPRAGRFSNLGRVYVNNDATNLYVGFEQVMIYRDNNVFLFVGSPGPGGVTTMAGVGNGLLDPEGQGADGLDCLENLSFDGFAPMIGCLLGDERGDGQFRSFARPGLALNVGQGIFQLDSTLSDIPGARLQQFNRSPQVYSPGWLFTNGPSTEQNADFIEVAIPLAVLGGLQPGQTIQVGAVVGGGAFDAVTQTRGLDTSALGYSLAGSGQNAVALEGVRVRLAVDPSLPWLTATPLSSNQIRLSWNAEVGRKYDLERSSDLNTFARLLDPRLPLTASSTNESFLVSANGSATAFFRLQAVP